MDQSQNGHVLGPFDHGEYAVDYGFDGVDGQVFASNGINNNDQAFYPVEDHASQNTQGLHGFQQDGPSYEYYPDQFAGQQHISSSGAQQHGVAQYGYDSAPPPIQSAGYAANDAHPYHSNPALGDPVNGYNSHAGHQSHAGYQANQTSNLYSGQHQPQTTNHVVNKNNHTDGHLYGQFQPQTQAQQLKSLQPMHRPSPSPQPYQNAANHSPFGHHAGQTPALGGNLNSQQVSVTPPIHSTQAGTPDQPMYQQQPTTFTRQHVYQQPVSRPQPVAHAQAFTQPQAGSSFQGLGQQAQVSQNLPMSQPPQGVSQRAVNGSQAPMGQVQNVQALTSQPSHQLQPPQPSSLGRPPARITLAQANQATLVPDPWMSPQAGQSPPPTSLETTAWETAAPRNFEISSRPIVLNKQKYLQTSYLFADSSKRRLFPQRDFLIASEALGKFMDGMEALQQKRLPQDQQDKQRKTLYLILKYDLKRAERTIDQAELAKVISKEASRRKIDHMDLKTASDDIRESRSSSAADPSCEVEAILSTHPAWGGSTALTEAMAEDLELLIEYAITALKGKPEYKELDAAIKRRRADPGSVTTQQVAKITEKVAPHREKVGRLLTAIYQKAPEAVVDEIARTTNGLPAALPSLWNLALNCANTADSGSPLVKAILQFSTRFSKLDTRFLTVAKFPQLAPKFEAQGGPEVKAAISKIREIAAKNPSPPVDISTSAAQSSKVTAKSKSTTTTTKPTTTPKAAAPAKEMPADRDKAPASKAAAASSKKRPIEEGSETSAPKKPATGSLQRPAQPAEKPVINFNKLQPASKRAPGTGILPGRRPISRPAADPHKTGTGASNAGASVDSSKDHAVTSSSSASSAMEPSKPRTGMAKPTVPAIDTAKARGNATASPSSSSVSKTEPTSSSRFSALLAEISEPQPTPRPTARVSEKVPDYAETDEERERRRRKEQRRKLNLRVSFKADAHLAEVRVFEKEEGEDEGLESNMIRDAADDKAEGKMLKASRRDQMTLGREWEEPTPIDFSPISDEKRPETYTSRGGLKPVQTEEQKIMAKEEMTQLMVVYTDHGDIPPTPASPRSHEPVSNKTPAPEVPKMQGYIHHERPLERLYYGPDEQLNRAWGRKLGQPDHTIPTSLAENIIERARQMAPQYEGLTREERDQKVLELLSSDRARNYVDPEPYNPAAPRTTHRTDYADPAVQEAENFMQGIVSQFQGLPAVAEHPPEWMTNARAREEWYKGFYADQAKKDHDRHQAEVARQEQAQQAQQQQAAIAQAQAQAAQMAAAVHQTQDPAQKLLYQQWATYYQGQVQTLVAQAQAQAQPQVQAQAAPQQVHAQPAQQQAYTGLDPSVQAILASLNQGGQPQQQHPVPAAPVAPVVQPAQVTPDVAAILAQLAGAQGQQGHHVQQHQQQQPAAQPVPDLTALLAQLASSQGHQGHQQQPTPTSQYNTGYGHDNRRDQENRRDSGDRDGGRRGGGHGGGGGRGRRDDVPDHLKGINRSLIGTKQCSFWVKGQCAKGDKCTFRHSD